MLACIAFRELKKKNYMLDCALIVWLFQVLYIVVALVIKQDG